MPRYLWLTEQAEKVWRAIAGSKDAAITLEDEWKLAVECLSVNYHVGAEEVSFLRLVATDNLAAIMRALVDWPGFVEIMKSLEAAQARGPFPDADVGLNIGSGATDLPQATAPASPT